MYRLGSLFPMIIGLLFSYLSYTLSLGEITNPGPGLWPFILSLVLVFFSVLLFVVERTPKDYESFKARAIYVAYGIGSLILFILAFQFIGFLIPGFLTTLFWFKYLGREPWKLSITIAIFTTLCLYLLFVVILGIPFPDDILIP